ncbi:MAG TPA: hypothetical protein VHA52_11540 [Candidatus Babeliaceae bacterium]|nr:hypothetical protein [Candidatus Babeliaceae bacterium]
MRQLILNISVSVYCLLHSFGMAQFETLKTQWDILAKDRQVLEERVRLLKDKASVGQAQELGQFMQLFDVASSLQNELLELHAQAKKEQSFVQDLNKKNKELYQGLESLINESAKEQAELFKQALDNQNKIEEMLHQRNRIRQEGLPTAEIMLQLRELELLQDKLYKQILKIKVASTPENQAIIKSFLASLRERDRLLRDLFDKESLHIGKQAELMERLQDVELQREQLKKDLERVKSQGSTQEKLMVDRIMGAMDERQKLLNEREYLQKHLNDARESIKNLHRQEKALSDELAQLRINVTKENSDLAGTIEKLQSELAAERERVKFEVAQEQSKSLQRISLLEQELNQARKLFKEALANASTREKIMLDNIQGVLKQQAETQSKLDFSTEERQRLEGHVQEQQKIYQELEENQKKLVQELAQKNIEYGTLLTKLDVAEKEKAHAQEEIAELKRHLNIPQGSSLIEKFDTIAKERADLMAQLQMLATAYEYEASSLLQQLLESEQERDKLAVQLEGNTIATGSQAISESKEKPLIVIASLTQQIMNLEQRVAALEKQLYSVTSQLQDQGIKISKPTSQLDEKVGAQGLGKISREPDLRPGAQGSYGKESEPEMLITATKTQKEFQKEVGGAYSASGETPSSWWLVDPSELKRLVDGAIMHAEQLLYSPIADRAKIKLVRKELEDSWLDYEMAQDPAEPQGYRSHVLQIIKQLNSQLQGQ